MHSANMLCEPVYTHANSLNTKFTAFLTEAEQKLKDSLQRRKHRIDHKHHTYMTIAVITTRPDRPLSPGSTETVLLWPISRR